MEVFHYYKEYGISYSTLTGTTRVDFFGQTLKSFQQLGEAEGKRRAYEWIDSQPAEVSIFDHLSLDRFEEENDDWYYGEFEEELFWL